MEWEPITSVLLGAPWMLLSAACVLDVLRRDRPREWLYIILFFPCLGAFAYLAQFYILDAGSNTRLTTWWVRRQRVAELERLSAVQDTPGLWLELGELYAAQERWEPALQALRRVLDRDPDLLRAHYTAAVALLRTGRLDAGLTHMRFVLDSEPEYRFGEARLLLARALDDAGRREEALAELDAVLQRNNFPEAVFRRARLHRHAGRIEEARKALARLVAEGRALPWKDRGWVRQARRELDSLGAG